MRITIEKRLSVVMRDRVALAADLYRPDLRWPLPTLLRRTAYEHDAAPAGASLDATRLIGAGYNLVVQHVRGRHDSGGTFVPFRQEIDDGADTISWITSQPWSDGHVMMVGRSYDGAAQWLAARNGQPALRAITPHVTGSDFYDGWTHFGGAFQLGFCLHWVLTDLILPTVPDQAELIRAVDGIADYYRRPWRALRLLRKHAPYYEEWLRQPPAGDFWRAVAPNRHYESVRAATLNVGGWYDIFLDGTLENYVRMRAQGGDHRLVIGAWSHCVTGGIFPERRYGYSADEAVLDLTGAHLDVFAAASGNQGAARPTAPVRLFIMGVDRWYDFADWPPPQVSSTRWYLHSGGGANTPSGDGWLDPAVPDDEPADIFCSDPMDPVPTCGGATLMTGRYVGADCGPLDQRAIGHRDDILCYTSNLLPEPLAVVGPVTATLYLSSSARDTDVAVKLVDVWPDGRAELLCDGIVRVGHHIAASGNTMALGRVHQVAVEVGATGAVLGRGHRVRVDVSGSNFPRFDVNPNTGGKPLTLANGSVVTAVNHIHHSTGKPSHITLPVLPLNVLRH